MRTKQGVITSASMQNTVTVTVHRAVLHPMYSKRFRVSKKFLADTNGHNLGIGDEVIITECRPLSKRKRFKVTDIVKQAPRVSAMADDIDPALQRDHRDRDAAKKDSSPQS
jgi:small subunit ribosomal protein S17